MNYEDDQRVASRSCILHLLRVSLHLLRLSLTLGNLTLASSSSLSLGAATVSVTGDLVISPDAVLRTRESNTLLVGGCLKLDGAILHLENLSEEVDSHEFVLGTQDGVDCAIGELKSVDVESGDSCLGYTVDTRTMRQSNQVVVLFNVARTCSVSTASASWRVVASLAAVAAWALM